MMGFGKAFMGVYGLEIGQYSPHALDMRWIRAE
jgi:hypothetical protein